MTQNIKPNSVEHYFSKLYDILIIMEIADEKDIRLSRYIKNKNSGKFIFNIDVMFPYAVRELKYLTGTQSEKYVKLIKKNLESSIIGPQLLPYVEGVFDTDYYIVGEHPIFIPFQ
tara:strand:+ start:137 stop:481 length:345 start_codon:yes stop_codon:yes gene_type:complete